MNSPALPSTQRRRFCPICRQWIELRNHLTGRAIQREFREHVKTHDKPQEKPEYVR